MGSWEAVAVAVVDAVAVAVDDVAVAVDGAGAGPEAGVVGVLDFLVGFEVVVVLDFFFFLFPWTLSKTSLVKIFPPFLLVA